MLAYLVLATFPLICYAGRPSMLAQNAVEKTTHEGKFNNLTTVSFKGRGGKRGTWEILDSYKTDNPSKLNGVNTIVKVIDKDDVYFMFNKQYRFALRSWTLEFPGGGVNKGESALQAALRELKEETGYQPSSIVFKSRGRQGNFAARSSDVIQYLVVQVDQTNCKNETPEQYLDAEEETEVVLIKASDLLTTLQNMHLDDVMVAANVYSFAIGYSFRDL